MTPFAYAVVNDQGFISGCYRSKDVAEHVLAKGVPAHNEKIVALYTADQVRDASRLPDGIAEALNSGDGAYRP